MFLLHKEKVEIVVLNCARPLTECLLRMINDRIRLSWAEANPAEASENLKRHLRFRLPNSFSFLSSSYRGGADTFVNILIGPLQPSPIPLPGLTALLPCSHTLGHDLGAWLSERVHCVCSTSVWALPSVSRGSKLLSWCLCIGTQPSHSVLCPFPRAGGAQPRTPFPGSVWRHFHRLCFPPPPPSPPSSIYFPNLVRLPCSSLIGPWKIIAVWKSLAGWNFLFGKQLPAPLPASTLCGQGCTCTPAPDTVLPAPALPSWPPFCSLFTLQLCFPAGFSPPPRELLCFLPAYLFSLCKAHCLEREWALVKQNPTCHPQQLCKARFLLTPGRTCFHCFLSKAVYLQDGLLADVFSAAVQL